MAKIDTIIGMDNHGSYATVHAITDEGDEVQIFVGGDDVEVFFAHEKINAFVKKGKKQ